MNLKEQPDAFWKEKLSDVAYQSLRRGVPETPHSGAFVKETASGTYQCAGCGAPLFDSEQKVTDGSGYATFGVPETDETVEFIRTYSEDGTEHTGAACANCGGRVGLVGTTMVRGSDDAQQAVGKRVVHAYSASLTLHKAFTPRNRPISYLAILVAVAAGVAGSWWGLQNMMTVARDSAPGVVKLSIDEQTITADLFRAAATTSGAVVGNQPVFVMLDLATERPVLKLGSRDVVDVLWLGDTYKVVSGEIAVTPDVYKVISIPDGAHYAMVTRTGHFPAAFYSRSSIIVIRSVLR